MPRHTNNSPNVFPFLDSGRKFKNSLIIKAFLRATVESLFLSAQKKKKKKKKKGFRFWLKFPIDFR